MVTSSNRSLPRKSQANAGSRRDTLVTVIGWRRNARSYGFTQLDGFFQVYRNELRDAAFRHGDSVETVHPRHGYRIVGDDDEAGVGRAGHFVEQIAETLDVVIVERGVYLVQH